MSTRDNYQSTSFTVTVLILAVLIVAIGACRSPVALDSLPYGCVYRHDTTVHPDRSVTVDSNVAVVCGQATVDSLRQEGW